MFDKIKKNMWLFKGIASVLMFGAGIGLLFCGPVGAFFGSGLICAGVSGGTYVLNNPRVETETESWVDTGYLRAVAGGALSGAILGGTGLLVSAIVPASTLVGGIGWLVNLVNFTSWSSSSIAIILSKGAVCAAGGALAQALGGWVADGKFDTDKILLGTVMGATSGVLIGAVSSINPTVVEDAANAVVPWHNSIINYLTKALDKVFSTSTETEAVAAASSNILLNQVSLCFAEKKVMNMQVERNQALQHAHVVNTDNEVKAEEIRQSNQRSIAQDCRNLQLIAQIKSQDEEKKRTQEKLDNAIRRRVSPPRDDRSQQPLVGNNRNTTFSVPRAEPAVIPANDESPQIAQKSDDEDVPLPPRLRRK